jgi:hypothetical protein
MALGATISLATYRVGDPTPPIITVTGAAGPVVITSPYGEAFINEDGWYTFMPENVSHYAAVADAVPIEVTDGVTTVNLLIDVFATFPFQPDWGFNAEVDEKTDISEAEDGSETYGVGPFFGTWDLAFNDREHAEYMEAIRFKLAHKKSRFWYLEDKGLEERAFVRFDSSLKRSPINADSKSYAFAVKAIQYSPVLI